MLRLAKILLFFFLFAFASRYGNAQSFPPLLFQLGQQPIVKDSLDNILEDAWLGGLNSCQIGSLKLNSDTLSDLLVFDKTGNRILPFLASSVSGTIHYHYAPYYIRFIPPITDWMQLTDYNNDEKNDLFTHTLGGIMVYKNTSDTSVRFTLSEDLIQSKYFGNFSPLFCLTDDNPAIADIDADGDLDILNFWVLGMFLNYHKNLSMEKWGIPDSLDFQMVDQSWGCFAESESSYHILLDTCINAKGMLSSKSSSAKHSGSTLLALDMDDDGDKDLVLGDVDYSRLALLRNGGNKDTAHIVAVDTLFPNPSFPVNLVSFPSISEVDIDQDSEKDLVFSPFDPNAEVTESSESVLYYKRYIQSASDHKYVPITNSFLQNQSIDLGSGAYPVIYDVDKDGKKDLLIANWGKRDSSWFQNGFLTSKFTSSVSYYRNTGTITNPQFKLQTRNYANLSLLNQKALYPTFGDIDGDGSDEMIVGCADGTLFLFENSAPANQSPQFYLAQSHYQGIDVGDFSTPQLFDLDKDSKQDLIIGERFSLWKDNNNQIIARKGNLNYYRNTGSSTNPQFQLVTDSLGGVDVNNWNFSNYGYSVPCFYRTPGGETRLICGNHEGYALHYTNIDNNLNGTFLLNDTLLYLLDYQKYKIKPGIRSSHAIADLNNDGFPDLISGNFSGGVTWYQGVNPQLLSIPKTEQSSPISIYPNPANNQITIRLQSNFPKIDVAVFEIGNGRLRLNQSLEYPFVLNTSILGNGLYLLKITLSSQQSFIQKLVIVR